MSTAEYRSGRAEGLAMCIAGINHEVNMIISRSQTISDMAGWLVTNGGDQFVLDLAAAISRERHPANSEAADEPELLIVRWRINGKNGHGDPVTADIAKATADDGNRVWGAGTHWVEVTP